MKRCTRCLLPDTKPDLHFDSEGVCSACRNFDRRKMVDWEERRKQLIRVLDENKRTGPYDCLIPVSGGKDSHYQVLRMLELGANPLCLTMTTDSLSLIGRWNIESIKKLGVDYVEFTPNPIVRKKIAAFALRSIGDVCWCEHASIFGLPIEFADRMEIGLVVYGELSQDEYGGPVGSEARTVLDKRWREEFGGLLGLRPSDLREFLGLLPSELVPYTFSEKAHLAVETGRVKPIFLGQYEPWDGLKNATRAFRKGFRTLDGNPPGIVPAVTPIEGQISNYENLDNHWTGVHDYFKYLKFGFGRATDLASTWIRHGRISREAGERLIPLERVFPNRYLGHDLIMTLDDLHITLKEFREICDIFTNEEIFRMNKMGGFVKKEDRAPVSIEEVL